MTKGINSKEVAEKTIQLQNVAKVARLYNVTDNGIRHHLKLEGVILREVGYQKKRKWMRVSDNLILKTFKACNGDIGRTASILDVAESYVQAVINQLFYCELEGE